MLSLIILDLERALDENDPSAIKRLLAELIAAVGKVAAIAICERLLAEVRQLPPALPLYYGPLIVAKAA